MTAPLNSGPYEIVHVDPGYSITLARKKDYWGKDLAINKGKYNLDKFTLYFHRDQNIAMQAFKNGEYDVHVEQVGKNWALEYNFPAVKDGTVKKTEIPTRLIIGNRMLFFNTRNKLFEDIRVREALGYMFDFEWTNHAIFYDAYIRSHSYFPNSVYASKGLPDEDEMVLLRPWKKQLPDKLFNTAFEPPVTHGDGNMREQQSKALKLLESAGWHLDNGALVDSQGKPFEFEILGYSHSFDRTYSHFIQHLTHLGLKVHYRIIDMGAYVRRIRKMDFDMVASGVLFGLTIGDELIRYFHSSYADGEDSQNLAGIKNPVVDALLDQLPEVKSRKELLTLAHSLDRVLLWNHYGIPLWYYGNMRLAYKDIYQWPDVTTPFPMFLNTWWLK